MPRLVISAAFGLFLAAAVTSAAETPPAGSWKLHVPLSQNQDVHFLLAFSEKDGKWAANYLGSSQPLRVEPKLGPLTVKGQNVQFTLSIGGREMASFDGVASKDGKKILGSLRVLGGPPQASEMSSSKLKKLDDAFALALETLGQMEDGPIVFELAFEILDQASAKKLPVEEVRGIVERLTKLAAGYGPRWERSVALRLATVLLGQEGFSDVALAQARRAERMIGDDDDAATVMETLALVARGLTVAGKPDEAKPYAARIAKLETKDYLDYAKAFPAFKPDEFAGRKAKSDRCVLVEILSGTTLPASAAMDLAGDALQRTYKPSDVIVLHYHYHIGGLNPLTNPENVGRIREYAAKLPEERFPFAAVDGKLAPVSGGAAGDAEKDYKAFRKVVDAELEKPAAVKLALAATKADKGYTLKANVTDLATPGEKMTLRFALAEDKVRYKAANGLRYHHMVVRALPGGAKGFPLTKKDHEQTVTVDPQEVRKELQKHLETITRSQGEQPPADVPLDLKGLKAVAFVQNDATGEVLNAVQIDLDAK